MVPTTTPSAEFVRAAKAGDQAAFGGLVDRYADATYRYALALLRDPGLAEDAAQDAFIDAFLHLSELREDAAFPAWLRRILLKHADRQRRRQLPAAELFDVPGGVDPLLEVLRSEERRTVHGEVELLPERLRACVELFYGAGLSVSGAPDVRLA